MSAPKGLVSWLRWLTLLASLSVAAATLPVITLAHAPFPPVTAAVGACVVLAVTWTAAYRSGSFTPWADVLTAAALLLVMLQLGSLVHALPLALAAAAYRGVWDCRRRVLAATALQAGAFVLAALGSTLSAGPPWANGEAVVGVLLQLFVALGTHEVAVHLVVHDRAARHRQVLTDAAGELLRAADPVAIAAATLDALRRLLPADAAVAVALAKGQDLEVVSSDDPSDVLARGRRLSLRSLPTDVREHIDRGVLFDTHARAADPFPTGGDLGETASLMAPLTSHGVLRGVALVRGERLDDDALTVVGALVSEAALALATAALTADLRDSETRFRSLVQNSSDLIAIVTERARIRYVSPAAQQVIGYSPELLKGADLVTLVHPDDLPAWRRFLGAEGSPGARWSTTCRLQHRSGAWRYTEVIATDARTQAGVNGIVLNMRDVTEQTMLEADLRRQATHDPLTNLPNRSLFMDRVRASLADPQQRRLAVLFVDLDNFKLVNDRFGHGVGDTLLCSVATRLSAALSGHTIARLGGDEFAVLAEVPGGRRQAEALARQILDALEEPLLAGPHELRSRASIGIALGDGGIDDAGDLLRRADLAMYVTKGSGKAGFELFDRHTYETLGVQRRLQAELGTALESGELEVRYQPIVDLNTLEICSAEALVRWHHPAFGLLGPSAFIHLAQDEGLLHRLFELVLREACLQARTWIGNPTTGSPVAVSVNLAPPQLDDDELVGLVEHALDTSGLAPALLTLELTENVLVTDPRRAARTMTRLKQLGVALAVDDFGTGYSSLSYLRRLPVDVLKIDQTFVEALGRPDSGSALVRTIVNLGNELGLATVAEGVEREDQRVALRGLGCRHGQGFLFSRPLSATDFGLLLAGGGVVTGEGVLTEGGPAPVR